MHRWRGRARMAAETVFWGGLMALALYLFLDGFLPAAAARREAARLARRQEQENLELRRELIRQEAMRQALENDDPAAVEQKLRDLGYTPSGRIRLVDPENQMRPPGTPSPTTSPPEPPR